MASLSYQYAQSVAWLDDLARDRDPHAYDLCERHSARLSVPGGWQLDDRRAVRRSALSTRLAG